MIDTETFCRGDGDSGLTSGGRWASGRSASGGTVRSRKKFGNFPGFLSEIFGQKNDFSKLSHETSSKASRQEHFEKSIFWPKISLQKLQK